MPRDPATRILVLSGPIAAGKSTLGDQLAQQYGGVRFKTNDLIQSLRPNIPDERRALQIAGEALDRSTRGKWVCDALIQRLADNFLNSAPELVIVDSVRIKQQIDYVRRGFGPTVLHVHLTAGVEELSKRYRFRKSRFKELASFKAVRQNPTEKQIDSLAAIADVVIDTSSCDEEDVVARVVAALGRRPHETSPNVDVIVGGQYGSEGKGNIAAYMAPEYDSLFRVGGPNAGHKVFREPEPYTFHHLPSGTFKNESAKLLIGPGAVIGLETLLKEVASLNVPYDRLLIDNQAIIINQEDVEYELRQLRDRIGSTAQGVGSATARKILERWPKSSVSLAYDVPELKPYVGSTREALEAAYAHNERILLEGTQGTSLSLHHGSYPHVTSRDTTVSGCLSEAGIPPKQVRKVIMVCRTYPIRVESPRQGTSGNMKRELTLQEISRRSGIALKELQNTEKTSTTNKKRRIAEFDWTQLRTSTLLNGPTDIALTFVDYIDKKNRHARRYEQLTERTLRFIEEVERVTAVPVSLISTGFNFRCIIDRRSW